MNEFNDIDRELEAAFAQRPTALSHPSLRDVKHRARRHQRQRRAAVLSACALAGVGGVTALAQRSPANETTTGESFGSGDATTTFPTATTICYATIPTTVPQFREVTTLITSPAIDPLPVAIAGSYTLIAGDYPGLVAEMFGVTVAELDAANAGNEGYGRFIVGTQIFIPVPGAYSTITPQSIVPMSGIDYTPCAPLPAAGYRCSGALTELGDGWLYFEYCEPSTYPIALDSTTTSIYAPEETSTTVTCVELPIMTLPLPATTTTVFRAC